MITPDMIPDEVVKAALLTDERLGMRTVIAAALSAWPGADKTCLWDYDSCIVLPLPQEGGKQNA